MSQISVKDKSELASVMTLLLMILVVLGHTTRMFTSFGIFSNSTGIDNLILTRITSFLYSFHMPAFVAVSGCVFNIVMEDFNKYQKSILFVKKKIYRLLVPYYVFLILIVLPSLLLVNVIEIQNLNGFLKSNFIFIGDNRHLWYLPMLFFLFIILYFNYPFLKRHKTISLILSLGMYSVSAYIKIPIIHNVLYYFIFFYIGYLSFDKIENLKFVKNWWFLFPAITFNIIFNGIKLELMNLLTGITGILFCIGISWILISKVNMSSGFLKAMKRNSYGIYLFHPMLIYILFFYSVGLEINVYLWAGMLFAFSFIISFLLTEGIRKLGLKIIIGE